MLVVVSVVGWGIIVVCGVAVFQALFLTPVAPEYNADGKIERLVFVNKGRWT